MSEASELVIRPVNGKDKRGHHDYKLNKRNGRFGLDPRQKLFIDYYLESLNAYQSALRAGYSETNSRQATVNILSKPSIQAEITKKLGEKFRKLDINVDNVLQEIARMAYSNVMDFIEVDQTTGNFSVDLRKVDRNQAAGISEVFYDSEGRPRVKLVDKRSSLELLARYLKLIGTDTPKGPTGAEGEPLTIQSLDRCIQQVTIVNQQITVNEAPDRRRLPQQVLDAQLPEYVEAAQ